MLQRRAGGGLVTAHAGGPETVLGAQLDRLGTGAHQHLGDLAKAVQQCVFVVTAPIVVVAPARIGAMPEQQRDPFGKSLDHRVAEHEVECPYRVVGLPVDPVGGAEAPVEQELQPAVVGPKDRIVEPLRIVGIRAGVEQQRGQREGMGVRRLTDDAAFSFAHRTGEGGEAVGAVPHEVRVRVGPVLQQQPRRGDRVGLGKLLGDPRVAEVEQRRPLARPAGRRRPARVLAQEPAQRRYAGGRGGGKSVGRRQRRPRRQHLPRSVDALRRVVAVGQAGEVEKLLHLTVSLLEHQDSSYTMRPSRRNGSLERLGQGGDARVAGGGIGRARDLRNRPHRVGAVTP